MKIVINAFSARLGGGQTYLINLLQHLPPQPVQIMVFAPDSLVLPADPRVVRLQTKFPTNNPLGRAVWEKLMLPIVLRRLKADVLFCPGGVVATRAPRHCSVVTMFRNMIPFDMVARKQIAPGLQRIRNWILARVMLKSMASADLVIFISNFARSVIESRTALRGAVTIPHGIASHFRTQVLAPESAPTFGHHDYLLYVSRFDTYKNHGPLLLAYDQLPAALQAQYRLVLVGESNSPSGEQARAFIAERGLGARVVIAGAVKYDQLPEVYANARAILFSSSCENCPNILLEALAAGRPVLSSSVMPMPEFGGDAVLYYDPLDPDQICARMEEVLTDTALSAQLSARARERSALYDWSTAAKKTWDCILALPSR